MSDQPVLDTHLPGNSSVPTSEPSQSTPETINLIPSASSSTNTSENAQSESSDSRPRKKIRVESPKPGAPPSEPHVNESNTVAATPDEPIPPPCYFLKLPLELLAEILIYTHSSKDILAVARCTKNLCATLLNSSSNYIWKAAREADACPLPDPVQIFSEAAYAAFIFDGGICETCKRKTDAMYTTFALRLRFCMNPDCMNQYSKKMYAPKRNVDPDRIVLQWVPVTEGERCFNRSEAIHSIWPSGRSLCPCTSWANAVNEYNSKINMPDYLSSKATLIKSNTRWMDFCVKLHKWKHLRDFRYQDIRKDNDRLAKEFTETNGWTYQDVMNSTGYGPFHRHKAAIYEKITQIDLNLAKSMIEQQLLELTEKRQRRAKEAAYAHNRAEIDTHYQRLRSSKACPYPLPSLPVFRQLPVVNLLLLSEVDGGKASPSGAIGKTLQSTALMRTMLEEQLKKWGDSARETLVQTLGYSGWKTANKGILHPVERLDARWTCNRCHDVPHRYAEDGCLDFEGVCRHECKDKAKSKGKAAKRRGKDVWVSTMFIKDEKAITAMRKLVTLFGIDIERVKKLPEGERWVECTSCNLPMVLHMNSVLGHCHRHNNMELREIPNSEATKKLEYPFNFGLAQKLVSLSPKMASAIEMKNYGCRHCLGKSKVREEKVALAHDQERCEGKLVDGQGELNTDTITIAVDAQKDEDKAKEKAKPEKPLEIKKPNLFIFNGIRSHLKAKHGIEQIRDEDFFCAKPIEL
ncbi:hypothetical protein BDQ12DRAFT_738215 [Crucibulum laeve]|uniref:F-box domain-containing protein n=1 Tax=Crucibulum laeve TaxID=68775 RepID=A0A5C3LPE8_9AGAR|nr:hypothetical protein BDQ12DRAFT_738215 [Crucibulum laeve]